MRPPTHKVPWTQLHALQLRWKLRRSIISRMVYRVGVTSNLQIVWITSTSKISKTRSASRPACNCKTHRTRRCIRTCPNRLNKRLISHQMMQMAMESTKINRLSKSLSINRAKYMGRPLLDNSIRPSTSTWHIRHTTPRRKCTRRRQVRWIRTCILMGQTV